MRSNTDEEEAEPVLRSKDCPMLNANWFCLVPAHLCRRVCLKWTGCPGLCSSSPSVSHRSSNENPLKIPKRDLEVLRGTVSQFDIAVCVELTAGQSQKCAHIASNPALFNPENRVSCFAVSTSSYDSTLYQPCGRDIWQHAFVCLLWFCFLSSFMFCFFSSPVVSVL